MTGRTRHLVRRFIGALSRSTPNSQEFAEVENILTKDEFELWSKMQPMDQRHSIEVAFRFKVIRPEASIPEVRAALLHDVGKISSSLGVLARVLATIVGKRGQKFTSYHNHQRLGAEMLEEISSDPFTVKLVAGTDNTVITDINIAEVLLSLKRADDLVT